MFSRRHAAYCATTLDRATVPSRSKNAARVVPREDSNPAPRDPGEPALAITSDIASWSASSSETNTASGRERASAPAPNVSIALRSSASDPSFGALGALMASNSDFGAPAAHASIQAWAEGANGSGSGASRGLPFTAKSTATDARDLIVFTAAANGFTREDVESGGWFESSSLDASDSPEGAVTEAREGAASEVAAEEARASASCAGERRPCADSTTLLTNVLPSTPRRRTCLCEASYSTLDPSCMNE